MDSRRSLAYSLVATFGVVVAPTFVAFALLVFSQPRPYVLAAVIASVVLTAAAALGAVALWAGQPEAEGVAFGDLMLWNWIRQHEAGRTLIQAAEVLGYDRAGRRIGAPSGSQEERVAAMTAIAGALDAQNTYTLGHSQRVARRARDMAAELELSDAQIQELVLAASLHDVGNIGLPESVLRKAGELTVEERSAIEAHVLLGADMVEHAGAAPVVAGIRHHHERWSGDGYPDGLTGPAIPLYARVIAIAEAYDAMTSTRPYRKGFGPRDAIAILRAEAGTQFDPELVEAFIATLKTPFSLSERAPFLAFFGRQWRELWLVFRRIGAVSVSATASTVAIALILGSTVLSPGVAPEEAGLDIAKPNGDERADQVLGEEVLTRNDDDSSGLGAASEVPETGVAQVPDDTLEPSSSNPSLIIVGSESGSLGGGSGGADPNEPPRGGGTTEPPPGGGEEPQPEPEPTPEPEPEPEAPAEEDSKDKNPDANGNGNANGHDKGNGKP